MICPLSVIDPVARAARQAIRFAEARIATWILKAAASRMRRITCATTRSRSRVFTVVERSPFGDSVPLDGISSHRL